MLNWCKRKKKQAMFFKVDFAKAYDSVRWDYLLDILHAFGFGPNWCRWILGTFTSSMASILVNGSPTSEFPFCCGLKQGDPLAPYLFILIMESLHISFSRVVDDGLFKGFQLHGSVNISHLFYADDAMFIGEWSEQNLHNIVKVLNCFHLASGLKINIAKSQVLGVGVSQNVVVQAANRIGCAVLNTPFRYLGVTVGECMSRKSAWVGLVNKLQARLSKWKVKTLSIGGRLTLLKSVLGASPIYYMSVFKVPKGVLKTMESIRSKFFNGVDSSDRKISWVAWDNVLASKLNGGLGVSSFFALNRALLLKWVWRFISGDGSLWCKVIQAIYGSKFDLHVTDQPSIWCSILREVKSLKDSGFDFSSHCKKRIGDGSCTSFWYDIWLADAPLCVQFPRLFALELDKEIVVANKMGASSVSASFRPGRDFVSSRIGMLGSISFRLSSVSQVYLEGPPSEFPILLWVKQGDPLAPLIVSNFIMESLHISFISRVVDDGLFKVPKGVLKLWNLSVLLKPNIELLRKIQETYEEGEKMLREARELKSLKDSGFDFSSHCKKRIGDGSCTSFWYDIWLADAPLCVQFPCLFALELDKEIVVANKMGASLRSLASFRRGTACVMELSGSSGMTFLQF
ncbi:RNA-directed DNA polymerase, eukaryota [Tanacetum coccineum]